MAAVSLLHSYGLGQVYMTTSFSDLSIGWKEQKELLFEFVLPTEFSLRPALSLPNTARPLFLHV